MRFWIVALHGDIPNKVVGERLLAESLADNNPMVEPRGGVRRQVTVTVQSVDGSEAVKHAVAIVEAALGDALLGALVLERLVSEDDEPYPGWVT